MSTDTAKRDLRVSGDAKLARSETHRCDVRYWFVDAGTECRVQCSCGWAGLARPTSIAAWDDARRHRDEHSR